LRNTVADKRNTPTRKAIRPLQVQPLQEALEYAGLVNVWLTGFTGRAQVFVAGKLIVYPLPRLVLFNSAALLTG